jgi:O-antigen ligase
MVEKKANYPQSLIEKAGIGVILFFAFVLPLTSLQIAVLPVSLTQVAGITLGLLVILNVIKDRELRLHPAHFIAGIFITWVVLSLTWIHFTRIALSELQRLIELFMIFLFSFYFLRAPAQFRKALLSYIAGTFILLIGSTIIQFGYGPDHVLATYSSRLELRNLNANHFSYILSFALFFVLLLSTTYRENIKKAVSFILVLILFIAIIATGTRTTVIALVAAFAFLLCIKNFQQNSNRIGNNRKLLLTSIFAISVAPILFSEPFERILSFFIELFRQGPAIFSGESGIKTLDSRLMIWQAGIALIRENPIIGKGIGQFNPIVEPMLPAGIGPASHNAFIGVWAELGIVGLLILITLFIISALSILRNSSENEISVRIAIIVYCFILLNGTNILGSTEMWFMLGILISNPVE